jgi:hypothetical protein
VTPREGHSQWVKENPEVQNRSAEENHPGNEKTGEDSPSTPFAVPQVALVRHAVLLFAGLASIDQYSLTKVAASIS